MASEEHDSAVGLDIDGVITTSPAFFASLSRQWKQEGKRVHIVSSRSDRPEARQATMDELRAFGILYDYLYLLPSIEVAQRRCPFTNLDWYQKYLWQKVDYCMKHGVSLFYDDDAKVVELFDSLAPVIRVIHFVDGGGTDSGGSYTPD